MTTSRSSVRPPDSKMPWGTIIKPEFGLGHQKMTEYEIDQTVSRLNKVKEHKQRIYLRRGKTMEDGEISEMLQRLAVAKKEAIPDSDRRLTSSPYKPMGVVASYAWQGYN